MNPSRIVPIFTTSKLAALKDYYCKHFNFVVTFENDSYLGIKAKGSETAEIGFMLPENGQSTFAGGVTIGLDAKDVDVEYERIKQEGLTIATPLNDAPWGDRYFIVIDPIGISLYIYKQIEPAPEFKQYIKE
jgi:predicted enzyme related to lactoylglutathione lyase